MGEEKITLKLIIPLILLFLILGGGLLYWQKNKNIDHSTSANPQGIVLGDSDNSPSSPAITSGEIYSQKVAAIRKSINQGFEDLAEKAKYTALFSSEEIQQIINDTRQKIEEGVKTLQNLSLDKKFNEANGQEIKSLNLLLEAINSFDKMRQEADRTEAKRLSELYAYDIGQSNKILQEIQIPR